MKYFTLFTLLLVFAGSVSLFNPVQTSAAVHIDPLTSTNTAASGPVTEQISEIDGMTMVYIPAGFFLMGSDPAKDAAGEADEKPQNTVFVGSFWIDKTEVTSAMYARFLNEQESQNVPVYGAKEGGSDLILTETGWVAAAGKETLPVTNVTWVEAQDYCEWAGRRLPTEAEWEKAARGEAGTVYPWGDAEPDCTKASFDGCGAAPFGAGSLAAGQSVYGVHDMAGNMWEWVSDYYDEDYYRRHDEINPRGPDYEYYTLVLKEPLYGAVIKGGSWADGPQSLRAANRAYSSRTLGSEVIGFRCAVSGSGLIIQ